MDRDDGQDGIKNVDEENTPTESINTGETPTTELPGTSDTFGKSERFEPKPREDDLQLTPGQPEEHPTVAVEVEPDTVATPPEEKPADASASNESPSTAESTKADQPDLPSVPIPAVTPSAAKAKDKKRLLLIAAVSVVLFALVGTLTWWLLTKNNTPIENNVEDTLSSSIEQPKLGVALTVIDGTVEYMSGDSEWQAASEDTQLQEGDSIRTGADSRAVLTLDDGTAIRLDANTSIELESLSVDNIEIKHIDGTVYSRVVPSDRSYVVRAGETTYEALGTAFVTIKNENENGVQVYQSSVKTSASDEAVTEGKQYFKASADAALLGKITTIDINQLADSAFVNWNLALDESDANFKKRLGILLQVRQRIEQKKLELQAAEESRLAAERKAAEEKEAQSTNGVTRGTMTLEFKDGTLSWHYTGKAVHGYKLVYSTENSDPVFGSDAAFYFSNISDTSTSFSKKEKIGDGKYFVRVCAYTAATEGDGCVDYSNHVIINL